MSYLPNRARRTLEVGIGKQYETIQEALDNIPQLAQFHHDVDCASTEEINVSSPGITHVDGYELTDGTRVLVKDNDTNPEENGIYQAIMSEPGVVDRLERVTDFDAYSSSEIYHGAEVHVTGGNTQLKTAWVLRTPNPITVDTTELYFEPIWQHILVHAGFYQEVLNIYMQNVEITGTGKKSTIINWDPSLTIQGSDVATATTSSITLSGEQTISGVAVVNGDRVLVKDQAALSTNGIYVASTGSWTRAVDDLTFGKMFWQVSSGNYEKVFFISRSESPFVVESSDVIFEAYFADNATMYIGNDHFSLSSIAVNNSSASLVTSDARSGISDGVFENCIFSGALIDTSTAARNNMDFLLRDCIIHGIQSANSVYIKDCIIDISTLGLFCIDAMNNSVLSLDGVTFTGAVDYVIRINGSNSDIYCYSVATESVSRLYGFVAGYSSNTSKIYIGNVYNCVLGYSNSYSNDPTVYVINDGPKKSVVTWSILQNPIVHEIGLDLHREPAPLTVSSMSGNGVTPISILVNEICHSLKTGDYVYISGVVGNTAANGYQGPITSVNEGIFSIPVTGNGDYVSGGVILPAIVTATGLLLDAFTKDAGTYVRNAYGIKLNRPNVGSNEDLALWVVGGLKIPVNDTLNVDGQICIQDVSVASPGLAFRHGSTNYICLNDGSF